MSQFLPDGFEQPKPTKTPEQGPESYLTPDERKFWQRGLGFPEDFPPRFKSWLIDFMAVNIPQIPISQVTGVPQTLKVLDRNTNSVTVTNTTTETTLYSTPIQAGAMGSNRVLRIEFVGDRVHNLAATVTLRVKLGGQTLITATAGAGNTVVSEVLECNWDISLANTSSSTQRASGTIVIEDGDSRNTSAKSQVNNGTGTVNTSQEQTLAITVQWSTASANLSFSKRYVSLEIL